MKMITDIIIPLIAVGLAELGDKTQITSGIFATQYNSILVLAGVMTALTLLSVLTIYLGKLISKKINKNTISKIAGTLFIALGIIMTASVFLS
jgi:putative Ca2+/H+ antiporter (TMEM165/GDT1 family)